MTTGSGLSAGTGLGALLAAIQTVADCGAVCQPTLAGPGLGQPGLGQLAKDTVGHCATFA